MPRILIVDDEASVRSALRKLLERGGFEVREAASGKAALELIAGDSTIEAVVSDVLMPEINGVDLYDRLVVAMPHSGAGSSSRPVQLSTPPSMCPGAAWRPVLHKLDHPQLVVDAVRLALLTKA